MENIQTQPEHLTFEKVWLMFKETDHRMQETDRRMQETDRLIQETTLQIKDTDRFVKELGKQIGGLGNKFGSFNEGLFMPSLVKMLAKKFKCYKTTSYFTFKDNGNFFEIDLLGISEVACYIVEFKSHLREDGIDQTIKKIEMFKKYVVEYADKIKYGAIVATHHNSENIKKVIKNGLYFVSSAEDIAKLNMPRGFKPRQW